MAAIGLGPRGLYDLVARGHHLDVALLEEVPHYGNRDCTAHRLHEEVLERKDIDTVLIATGDRWHGVLSILAARAGKDVYSEKPFSLTVAEGRALVETMRTLGRVWQCGTQRRSILGYKIIVDAVRGGKIGKLHTITLSYGTGGGWRRNGVPTPEVPPPVEEFDWDRWLGQSPWALYSSVRVKLWRLNWETGAGAIADMGAHFCETAQWAHGSELSGPVEFEGEGVFREEKGFNNTPYYFNTRARYADGVRLIMDPDDKGVRFDGDEGWVSMSDFGEVQADPPALQKELAVPRSDWKVMRPHIRDFLDCVRSRKQTASHPEAAHRAHSIVHCTNIAVRLGRTLTWDPKTERFAGDEEANAMLARQMREPWNVAPAGKGASA